MSQKLKTVRVSIIDFRKSAGNNERTSEIEIPERDIQEMHGVLSRLNPDCSIYFKWWDGGLYPSSMRGFPVNMKMDATSVLAGEISFEEYKGKWYPEF